MRLLVYHRTKLTLNRGTPLRSRNLVSALANNENIALRLVSRDETAEIQQLLPVEHHKIRPKNLPEQMKAHVEEFKPDIVYGQAHKSMRDMVHLHHLERPKLVVDLHGNYPAERLEQYWRSMPYRLLSYAKERMWERYAFPKMDAFTVVSHTLGADVEKFQKPIYVLWGGVDLDRFKPCATSASLPIQVTYAGNFSPYQGVSILLEAAGILTQNQEPFHFNFIGNIDQFPELREAVEKDLAANHTIIGQVPYQQVPGLLAQADILVIPRISDRAARYGFPSKLPEYMATGKAIVITDIGEHSRVIQNGETGLIIPPDSASALSDALLILKDKSIRDRLGRNARSFVEFHLSWEMVALDLYNYFKKLLSGENVKAGVLN